MTDPGHLIGLSSLIYPHKPDQFLEEHWPFNPLIVHELDATVRSLRELPFLQSLEALLVTWPDLVQAHLPDVADESSAVHATPADARKLFANGMGLLFNNAHLRSPVLSATLENLRRDLGLPASTHARCMVYATPDGKGTAPHFDQNANFVLQLRGTKKWWLAPNTHVENPTERFTIGQPVDPVLAAYLETDLPNKMPEDRQEFVLSPGSMLFVPRGYWHCTEADGDALALNFTFSQPTWIDLFTLALRSRLSLSPQWRGLADGVSSADFSRREIAELQLDALLTDLVADLPNWRASDILGATEGDL